VALAVLVIAPRGVAPTTNAAPTSQPATAPTADTDAPIPADTDMDADTAAAPATPRADAMAELLQAPPTPAVADSPEPPTLNTTPQPSEDVPEPGAMADGAAGTAARISPEPSVATAAARPEPVAKELRGLAALDAEIAADRAHTEMDPAQPAAAPPATDGDLSGLAALDAEIAASGGPATRTREPRSPPTRSAAPTGPATASGRSGLAALDAEIAADRHQARHTRSADRAAGPGLGAKQGAKPRAERADAGTRQSGAATRGLAERRYLSALRQALERERHYPPTARRRRLEGTTRVQFTIAADGAFSGIHVSRSAGAASLDEAAVSTVRRLARFDPIPAAVGRSRWTVHVPIVFRLN
jgi:protein TonB